MTTSHSNGQRACIVRYQTFADPHVQREAVALRDAGYDVEVLCPRLDAGPRREIWNGITITRMPVSKTRGALAQYAIEYTVWFAVCFWYLAWSCLRGRRHDVIQITTLPDQQVFAALVPKLLGSRVVLFYKEPTAELVATKFDGRVRGLLVAWSQFVARQSGRCADQCIAVTDRHRDTYLANGLAPDKVGVVLNCPMTSHVGASAPAHIENRFVVLCHGTVEERMGQRLLVEAMDLVRAERPDVLLVLTGAGSFEAAVADEIDARELRSWVDFRGFIPSDELAALMARAGLGVVPMLPSGYSHLVHTTKMFEFMLRGVPVVAGNLGATVDDFPDACAYFTAGSAASLAATLVNLANDPIARAAQAERGRAAVEHNSWDEMQIGYVSLVAGVRPAERVQP